jgi:hypothetical protein
LPPVEDAGREFRFREVSFLVTTPTGSPMGAETEYQNRLVQMATTKNRFH